MDVMDLRGCPVPEIGNTLLAAYDAARPGERVAVRVDAADTALAMWLIEAGAHFETETQSDGVLVTATRAMSPALTAAPGVHHLIDDGKDTIWAAERGSRVARIDGAAGAVASVAHVADKGSHLALDPDGKWLYLADFAAGELVVMDAHSLDVAGRFAAPGGPQLPLAAGGGIACVTGPGSGTLTIVRPVNGGFAHQIAEVGDTPHDTVGASDGRHVFVACSGAGDVAKVDLETGAIVGRIETGAGSSHLAAHPDGQRYYCANSFDGTVTCFSGDGDGLATALSGGWAHHLEVSHDGARLYVSNFLDDTVSVFDTDTMEKITDLETEPYAHEIAISPDGSTLVLPGFSSDHIRIYDTATNELTARIKVGAGSPHTVFTDGGRTAWVACSVADHLARIDMVSRQAVGTLSL